MSKRELSPEARLVADGIAAMEEMITEGWKYNWRWTVDRSTDKSQPTCCLRGALMLTKKDAVADYTISDIAIKLHKSEQLDANGENIIVIPFDDWDGIKTALCKKYNLGVLA